MERSSKALLLFFYTLKYFDGLPTEDKETNVLLKHIFLKTINIKHIT